MSTKLQKLTACVGLIMVIKNKNPDHLKTFMEPEL